jgi:phage host-nuclease inhibitor protein Gam
MLQLNLENKKIQIDNKKDINKLIQKKHDLIRELDNIETQINQYISKIKYEYEKM